MILFALLACTTNQPPKFLTVNGVKVKYIFDTPILLDGPYPETSLGETLQLDIGLRDREGDKVRLWWSNAPPGFVGDPESTTATWTVPEDFWAGAVNLTVVAEDDHNPPAAEAFVFTVTVWGVDTGFDTALF